MNNRIDLYEIKRYISPKQIMGSITKPIKKGLFITRPTNYIPITETIKNIYFFIMKTSKIIKNKKDRM